MCDQARAGAVLFFQMKITELFGDFFSYIIFYLFAMCVIVFSISSSIVTVPIVFIDVRSFP